MASLTKSTLYRLFTGRLNMSAAEARIVVDEIEEMRKFDTEAELLAANLIEGNLAYASDTGNVFRRGSATTDQVGGPVTSADMPDPYTPVDGTWDIVGGISVRPAGSGTVSEAFGDSATATGIASLAVGQSADASGSSSTAVGQNSEASGAGNPTALGGIAEATGQDSTALGHNTLASGTATTVAGKDATATGTNGTAVGRSASSTVDGTVFGRSAAGAGTALGRQSSAVGGGVAVGAGALASGTSGVVAVGVSAQASVIGASSFGNAAIASALGSTALGENSDATHSRSVVIGTEAASTAANRTTLGQIGSNPNLHQELQVSGNQRLSHGSGDGQETLIQAFTTELVALSGASVTAASLIPAGAVLIGLTARVTSAITGATGFDIGDGVDVDRWGANIAIALDTTSGNGDWTDNALTNFSAANDVVLTALTSNFTGGNVRLTAHYLLFTPATQ